MSDIKMILQQQTDYDSLLCNEKEDISAATIRKKCKEKLTKEWS